MRDNLRGVRRAVRLRVGRNVRHLRLLRGLTQEGLAELVGNTNKHIGLVERGAVNVGIDILSAIAAHLSVNVSDLFLEAPRGSAESRTYLITDRELDQFEQSLRVVNAIRRTNRGARRRG